VTLEVLRTYTVDWLSDLDAVHDEYCSLLLVKEQVFATRGQGQCEGECKESLSDLFLRLLGEV
jgi:hypothetical protein